MQRPNSSASLALRWLEKEKTSPSATRPGANFGRCRSFAFRAFAGMVSPRVSISSVPGVKPYDPDGVKAARKSLIRECAGYRQHSKLRSVAPKNHCDALRLRTLPNSIGQLTGFRNRNAWSIPRGSIAAIRRRRPPGSLRRRRLPSSGLRWRRLDNRRFRQFDFRLSLYFRLRSIAVLHLRLITVSRLTGIVAIRNVPPVCSRVTATLVTLPFRMPLAIGALTIRTLTLVALLQVRGMNAKIVFRMLVVILGRYAIAGRSGIPRESQVFFVHLKRVTANSHAGSIAIEKILPISAPTAVTTAARAF